MRVENSDLYQSVCYLWCYIIALRLPLCCRPDLCGHVGIFSTASGGADHNPNSRFDPNLAQQLNMSHCMHRVFGGSVSRGNRCRCNRTGVSVRCDFSDNLMRVNKWQIGRNLQTKLEEAVARQDFDRAAGLRDSLSELELSPLQQLELHHATQLKNGSYHEKLTSLRTLGQLHPSEETLDLILRALHDEPLAVCRLSRIQDLCSL